jgi:hypothetical protein|tara:strand:- start:6599 stop:8434 length:1836 start_codon:yes stop_codon:yes gene_type:complete
MTLPVKIVIKAFDETRKGFGAVNKGLAGVTKSVVSMRSAMVLAAGAVGFGYLVKRSLDATDSLKKTADKIGTTTEALASLRYAANITGVSTNTMDMALQRFTRRTAEAAQGTGEAKGAIRELGINAKELNKMPLDKRMIVLADAFSNVGSESDKLRLAFKLFDSEGAALVNTLSLGSGGLNDLLGEAKALGLALSGSAAKGVEDTNDALTKLGSLFKGLTDQTVAAFAPAIEMIVERFTVFLQTIVKSKGGVEGFARSLAVDVLGAVQIALVAFEELANGFVLVYNTSLKLKDALTTAFTKDSERNARQLRLEVESLDAAMVKRAKRMEGESYKQLKSSKFAQKRDKNRRAELMLLMEAAIDAGESLSLLDKVSFAGTLNAEIELLKVSLSNFSEEIPVSIAKTVESINNVDLGFRDWQGTVLDSGDIVQKFTKDGLNGMTDALTAGITGAAKFSDAMKSMAKSVVDSLIKMLVQKYIVDAAFGFITASISGGGGGTNGMTGGGNGISSANYSATAAIGGSVNRGQPTLVGERGQEVFVPNQNGAIIPNNKLGGGGSGVTVNQTINISTGVQQTVRAEIATLMPQIANASKQAVADARQRGGGFSKALVGA